MSIIDTFTIQHKELLELAGQLRDSLLAQQLQKDAFMARSILSQIAGKLSVHLAMEDKHLYPALLKSDDERVRIMARQFVDEMGGLANTFKTYKEKWPNPISISKDPQSFITETTQIIKALGARIQKEDSQLYPLYKQTE